MADDIDSDDGVPTNRIPRGQERDRRERMQSSFLSGDRFGYAQARMMLGRGLNPSDRAKRLSERDRRARWQGALEMTRATECNLASPPEQVAHNFGVVRAVLLELLAEECKHFDAPPTKMRRRTVAVA